MNMSWHNLYTIVPMSQNKNHYSCRNMMIGTHFRNHFHILPNKCTYKFVCNHLNNFRHMILCKLCRNDEGKSKYILQSKCQLCNN